MIYLYIIRHVKSGLLWFGKTSTDPYAKLPKPRHSRWTELVTTSPKVAIVQVRAFENVTDATCRYREVVKKYRVRTSPTFVNSDYYINSWTPYVYLIKHRYTGQLYLGSKYGRKANPSKFFVNYFTSSNYVKSLGWTNFDLVELKATKNARDYEAYLLQSWYAKLGRDEFCRVLLNRSVAPGFVHDAEARANISAQMLGNTHALGYKHTKEALHQMSIAKLGGHLTEEHVSAIAAANTGKRRSAEMKARMSAASSGKPKSLSHRARLREVNLGKKLSAETRAKISAALIGKITSTETRARLRASRLGRANSAECRAKISSSKRGRPWSAARRLAQKVKSQSQEVMCQS